MPSKQQFFVPTSFHTSPLPLSFHQLSLHSLPHLADLFRAGAAALLVVESLRRAKPGTGTPSLSPAWWAQELAWQGPRSSVYTTSWLAWLSLPAPHVSRRAGALARDVRQKAGQTAQGTPLLQAMLADNVSDISPLHSLWRMQPMTLRHMTSCSPNCTLYFPSHLTRLSPGTQKNPLSTLSTLVIFSHTFS